MVDPYPDLRARGLISCMQCWQSAGSLLDTYGTHRNMLSITSSVLSRSTLLVRDEREYGLISCIHSQRRVSGRCEHGHVAQLTHSERIPPYRTVARGASYDPHIARHRSGIVTRRPDDSHCSLRFGACYWTQSRTVARGASHDPHTARQRSGIVTRRPDQTSSHAYGHADE